MSWVNEGRACSSDGIRHDQVLAMANVPRLTPAATIAPIYHEQLNSDVRMGRSFGCDNSPISDDAPTMANGIPSPRIIRDITNIATTPYMSVNGMHTNSYIAS